MRAVVCVLVASALVSGCTKERERPNGSAPLGPSDGSQGSTGSEPDGAPPISGGTLLITADGERAFVSDPDRNRVLLVDLGLERVDTEISLAKGSHPARAVEDADGFIHVLLRGAGTLLTISPEGEDLGERAVCAAPRGIDYDADRDELVVACVGGELSRLDPAPGGERLSKTVLEPDLRDVVVLGDKTFVSVFRRPKVLVLDAEGNILNEVEPPGVAINGDLKLPTVAWRMVEWPGRGVVISHQRASTRSIEIGVDAPLNTYGQGEDPLVEPVFTVIDEDGVVVESVSSPFGGVLPVDVGVNENGDLAVTMASSNAVVVENVLGAQSVPIMTQPVAAQYRGGDLVVQGRQPAELQIVEETGNLRHIDLGGDNVTNVGHMIFHGMTPTPTPLACASCHPEGRDDAHTWSFAPLGPRRTQTLLGDVTETAPFHWDGDQKNLGVLMDEVFTRRMGNQELSPPDLADFSDWLAGLRDLPASAKDASPGRVAFEKAGCDTCHSGKRFTTGGNADVGTGATFQIPSLVGLRYRTPLLHDGCAATIEERFGPCGGDDHGDADKLDDAEMDDLFDYLRSL